MKHFDLAVIGAGSARLSVGYVAGRLGLRVALIERERMGGECLNTGCVPSKALLAAAHAAMAVRAAGRFGVMAPEPSINWPSVRAHVRGAITALEPADSAERYQALGATVLWGHARLRGGMRLRWMGGASPLGASSWRVAAARPCQTFRAWTGRHT